MENLKQKLYDLRGQQKALVPEIRTLVDAGDLGEDYQAKTARFDELGGKIKAIEDQLAREGLFDDGNPADKGFNPVAKKTYAGGVLKGLTHDTVKSFADGVRKAMTEGTLADGGYTVPTDVVTRIYELVTAEESMLSYITNTPVTAPSGKRTYKTRQQLSGLQTVAEMGKIPKTDKPTFAQIEYVVAKRAGYLPASVELLEDSDENIAALVINWFADEVRVTVNMNTVATAKSIGATAVSGLEDIMQILTEELGSAIRSISTIHTNDSGLLWLLNLKNGQGDSLLQPRPNHTEQMQLCIGPMVIPIKPWDNTTLPNEGDKIPMFIGSLKEGIQRFDRKALTVSRLTEATVGDINLAEQDMVAFKGTMRDDYRVRDAAAFRYCELSAAAG